MRPELTVRERQLVRVLQAGSTNREIAERLGLREQTVRNRLSVIYAKLGVRNRLDLVLRSRQADASNETVDQ
ncbi:MAG: LuxR C-terminal-related transcriptional regulator [Vicinamibacterales bacterium]